VDEHVPPEHRGTYLAFADDGNAAAHLRRLAKAGINTVHLLPSFDFSTVDEDRDSWREPPAEIARSRRTAMPSSSWWTASPDTTPSTGGTTRGMDDAGRRLRERRER